MAIIDSRLLALPLFASVLFLVVLSGCIGDACSGYDPVCASNGVTYNNSCQAQRANASIMGKGTCASLCADSDGGKDLFASGSAKGVGAAKYDSCESSQIREAYCAGGIVKTELYNCPLGYECKSGACVESTCLETDDGNDKMERGTVTIGTEEYADACDGSTITEYFCEYGAVQSEEIACGKGFACKEGACIEVPCTDSDSGNDTAKAGTVTIGDETFADVCSAGKLTEYYCDDGEVKSSVLSCQTGYSCAAGKCAQDQCSDSDGGAESGVKGTTTLGTTTRTDSCYSPTAVNEHYCPSTTTISTTILNCLPGTECLDGKCREVECESDETQYDDEDKKQSISSLDGSFIMYEGQVVELNKGYLLEVASIGTNFTDFSLYENIADYRDGDDLCTFTLDEGDNDDNFCSKTVSEVELEEIDGDAITINADFAYAVQFYTMQGEVIDWTDSPACDEDEASFDSFESEFFPYIDTNSSNLDLDGSEMKLFDATAEIVKVYEPGSYLKVEIDGSAYTIEDGETFEYKGLDYIAYLDFTSNGGLQKITIEPD